MDVEDKAGFPAAPTTLGLQGPTKVGTKTEAVIFFFSSVYFQTLARLDHKPGGGGNSRAATSPLPLGSAHGPLYCTSQLRACTCVTRPHLWANLGFTFSLITTVLEPFLPSVLGAFTGAVLAASECGRGGTRHSAKRPLFSRFSRAAAGSKSGVAALESALLRGAFLHRTSSPWCAQSSQSNLRS